MNGSLSTTVNPNWTYAQSPTNLRNTVFGMGVQSRQILDNTQNFLKNNVKPSAGVFAQNYMQGLGLNKTNPVTTAGKAAGFGKFLGSATPYLPAIGNVLEGDLVGGGASAAGAVIGSTFGPLGAIAGGMVGEPIVKGGMKIAGGLFGMDANNPLSGPDWSIPIPGGGTDNDIPISPFAKTKKNLKRAIELEKPFRERDKKAAMEQAAFMSALNAQNSMFNNQMQLLGKLYNK